MVTSRFGAGERLQGMDTKHPFEKVVADHGATVLRERDEDIRWTVLADPEGNEFCAFTP